MIAVAAASAETAAEPVAIASATGALPVGREVQAVVSAVTMAAAERVHAPAAAVAHPVWAVSAAVAVAVAALVVAAAAEAAAALAVAEAVVAVVVEAAAAVAVVVVAAAVAEGGKWIMKHKLTKTAKTNLCVLLLLALASATFAQTTVATKAKSFPTAEEAANALVEAAEKYDETALLQILGPDSYDIIHTGEPARDREVAKQFADQARVKMNVAQPKNSRRAFVNIGDDDWPFPVPIVKGPSGWSFDTKAGRMEILYRRVGSNELNAIQICRGYVEAQHEYALMKKTGGVNQYAQRIISTPGKQDGLAWQNADGTWDGPIGEKVAAAIARGYSSRSEPYHGYFFKVLKGQGPAAPLGELDFVVKDVMIGGFALIAFPATYRVTGVQTFMVSHDGVVYQKDLGPQTLDLAGAIDRFNPDKTWTPVLEQ